jgi:acetoin utilization deacetylase AcuC-like enzyme
MTGVVRDNRYLLHRPPEGHPESHRRLEAIYAMLDEPDMQGEYQLIRPRLATAEEIQWVHSAEYTQWVAATANKPLSRLNPDTYASADSWTAARLAAGGLLQAVAEVLDGNLINAFAVVRPPGHHAEHSRAMGYCILNNVALAAVFAQRAFGLKRILIADWDVHHGNGTQHAFERDPSVLFFSVHQYPLYPGTGLFTETGFGPGEGFTVNVPLPKGYGDGEFVAIFERLLRPLAFEFRPDLILVSAGFDCHAGDSQGGMRLTAQGFAALTRCLMMMAASLCDGRLVLVLEGGYHLGALSESVKAVLRELRDLNHCDVSHWLTLADSRKLDYALTRGMRVHRRHWKCLRERVSA